MTVTFRIFQGRTKLNSVCVSPNSDKNGDILGPSTEHLPGSDINVEELELTKELFNKVMALDTSSFDADKVDCEEHVPFDSSRYPDGANASLYMQPSSSSSSSSPRNRTHL